MAAGAKGSCKLCDFQFVEAFNRMIVEGKNQGDIRRAMYVVAPDFSWSNPTFTDHKRHITHPIITAQKAALANPLVVPKTNRGVLEAVRDIAMQKAIDHPEAVTVDQGLKAISIMESNKGPIKDIWIVLAKEMTKSYSDDIEGEFRELPIEEATLG